MTVTVNKQIFRSYDIRGIYPEEINEESAFLIGQAFSRLIQAQKIAVGRDARLSSPSLHRAFIRGLFDQGVFVHDLGMVPSEIVYFVVGKYGYDGGAVITASHNTQEYNGLRFVNNRVEMLPGKTIYEYIQKRNAFTPAVTLGRAETKDYLVEYIQHVLTFIEVKNIKPLKIIIDAGNGVGGVAIPELFKHLPVHYQPINFKPDGSFPSHPSNPILPESQTELSKRIIKERADLGVIFDGDADRLVLLTEKGKYIRPDISLLLLAKNRLSREPGAGVSYNVVCSRVVPEKIREWGGQPLRTKVGFVHVSGALRQYNGVVGGETSAHYCFRDNYYADSALIALVSFLEILSNSNQTLSELVKGLNPYQRLEEYFKIGDSQKVIAELKDKYSDGRQDELDGLTVEYPDWWFNVRPSNTEPLLRFTLEAKSATLLEEKKNELFNWLKENY